MQKQRRFRSRTAAADDDDADAVAAVGQQAAHKADSARRANQQEQRKADVLKKASLLSFEDDEEGAASAPAPTRAVWAQAELPQRAQRAANTQRSAPGEYSSERLQQLRQQLNSMPGAPAAAKPAAATAGGFKLSGSFKAAKKPADDRFEVNASDMMKVPPRNPAVEAPLLPPPARDSKRGGLAPTPQPPFAAPAKPSAPVADSDADFDGADGFSIPTADAIRWAKEKRERLRSAHLAPDYVPLGGAAALLSNQDAAARLRGDREGDSTVGNGAADSDDEQEAGNHLRMQFVGNHGKQAGASGVFASLAAQQGDEGDEDEDDAWVRQQLQKAGAADLARAQPRPQANSGAWTSSAPSAPAQQLDPVSQATAAGQSVMASLQDGLRRLQEKQQHVERQRKQTAANLEDALESVTRLERELQDASHKYTYLQETRGFIADMCDMLQAKAPIVEVLEERLRKAADDRADAAAAAEAADDREELEAAQAAVGAAISVLSRGGALPAAQQAAEAAAAVADAASVQNLPEALDEFGRDTNVEKRRQVEERLAKRSARAAAAAAAADVAQLAGDASDEDAAEVSQYEREREQILEAAATVFADAGEEYSTVAAVKRRLEDWQTSYPAAYRDAYMAVSAPAIFAPFVRLELLRWDPLFGRCSTGFDTHEWYQQLFEFTAPPAGAAQFEGEDADVVPVLVRNIVAPIALHLAERVWDPASTTHTRGMFSIVENLLIYVQPEAGALQEVLSMVRQRLAEAVSRAAVPRWPGEALVASPRAAAFVARQFSRAVRLLDALAAFEDMLQPGGLKELAVDQLLLQQILPLLRSKTNDVPAAVSLTERVVAALPASWSRQGLPKEAAGLAAFVEDLHRRAQSSQKSDPVQVQRLAQLSGKLFVRP